MSKGLDYPHLPAVINIIGTTFARLQTTPTAAPQPIGMDELDAKAGWEVGVVQVTAGINAWQIPHTSLCQALICAGARADEEGLAAGRRAHNTH